MKYHSLTPADIDTIRREKLVALEAEHVSAKFQHEVAVAAGDAEQAERLREHISKLEAARDAVAVFPLGDDDGDG